MKYLFNRDNLVREATLTANNIVGSAVIYRTDEDDKQGGGDVELDGTYTGSQDTVIDIKIVNNTITGDPAVSNPVLTGVGNGTMTDVAATSAVDPQEFTVTLEDLGTQTLAAFVPFQGVKLVAQTPGNAGNSITVSIDDSGLVKAPSIYSIPTGGIVAGTNQYTGDQWNFGAVQLNRDGTIPDNAPRLCFGGDPQVYRAYKQYQASSNSYVYSFSPAPLRDVQAGELVTLVTGSYLVTITDGVTPETFGASPVIVTLYDCLNAIRSGSALVSVEGVVVNDKSPNGQGSTDLSEHTKSYVLQITENGTTFIEQAEIGLTVGQSSPSETLNIVCSDTTNFNQETWRVTGDVSGQLSNATTGVAYSDGTYSFTIPLVDESAAGSSDTTGASMLVELKLVPRNSNDAQTPVLEVFKPVMGSAAHDGIWEFAYESRPPAPCTTPGSISGGPTFACLGVSDTGGSDVSAASVLIRQQRLAAAYQASVANNTATIQSVDSYDINWLSIGAKILSDCVLQLAGATTFRTWITDTLYEVDEIITPTVPNGHLYAVTQRGTTSGSEPSWTTGPGDAFTSGTAVFQEIGKDCWGRWDDLLTDWTTDASELDSLSQVPRVVWTPGATWNVNSTQLVIPATPNGHVYKISGIATTDSQTLQSITGSTQEPQWSTVSAEIVYEVVAHGDDGTIVANISWQEAGIDTFAAPNPSDLFFERYRSVARQVLLAGGISPNFDFASTEGDGCWHDWNLPAWFAYVGDEPYLPVQTGYYYVSSKKSMDGEGREQANSTKEFGFGPKISCPELLTPGDVLRITISGTGASSARGYQQGDNVIARIVHADPLPLNGGQDGDDTLTWSVFGGGTAGRLADYALDTTAIVPYSDGGISFTITPGGIAFVLGDFFTFSVEGGQFQYQQDGGGWSSSIQIADTVALVDGLVANFVAGTAPSWVVDDQWSFTAEATNGPEGIRSPTDARMSWETAMTLTIDPGSSLPVSCLLIAEHTIPSSATIRLQGSDNNFSTTPFDQVIEWSLRNIHAEFDQITYAKYRLTVDTGGSIQWLNLLDGGTVLQMLNGLSERGLMTKLMRLPSLLVRSGLGVDVTHSCLSQAAMDEFVDQINDACENALGRFGIVPNDADAVASIVTCKDDSLTFKDEFDFQPDDPTQRAINFDLTLEPIR